MQYVLCTLLRLGLGRQLLHKAVLLTSLRAALCTGMLHLAIIAQ